MQQGFDPDRYGALHLAVDAWARARKICTGVEIKRQIESNLQALETLTRDEILKELPEYLHAIPLRNFTIDIVEGAAFSASSNYWGHKGDYRGNYEYNSAITKTDVEITTLSMHEFLPGHHLYNAMLDALVKHGKIGIEAAISTMGTMETAFAEGTAVVAPQIAYPKSEYEKLDPNLRIAITRDELVHQAGRNMSYIHYQLRKGWDPERYAAYLREEGCATEEASRRLPGWLRWPSAGMIYLPCYGMAPPVLRKALSRHRRQDVLQVIYGVRGPVDLRIFPAMVEEYCRPRE